MGLRGSVLLEKAVIYRNEDGNYNWRIRKRKEGRGWGERGGGGERERSESKTFRHMFPVPGNSKCFSYKLT